MAEFQRPKMCRTFSSSNLHATNRIHDYVSEQERNQYNSHKLTREVTKSSMIIPTFHKMKELHRKLPAFIMNLIVSSQTLSCLEKDGLVNWCNAARSMVPLNTDADGNCLLHSISMYIFGVHDRRLNLRRFIYRYLVNENRFHGKLYVRWKYEQELVLRDVQNDFDSTEIRRDWDTVVQAASPHEFPNGSQGQRYSALEDIHIFTACIVLARPIIIISDRIHRSPDGRSLQPSRMGGIYLPVMRDPSECERTPIILVFWQNHFMPLLNGEDHDLLFTSNADHPDAQLCIPLVYNDLTRLPIRFTLANENPDDLLHAYLDCVNVPHFSERKQEQRVLAAMLKFKPPPAWSVELMWSLFSRAQETFVANLNLSRPSTSEAQRYSENQRTVNKFGASTEFTPQTVTPTSTHSLSGSLQSPLLSPTSSQPPISPTGMEKPRQTFLPCKRSGFGCKNFADPHLKDLCHQCHQVSQEDTKTVAFKFDNSGPERSEVLLERHGRRPSVKKCSNVSCKNDGFEQFRGLCRHCYTKDITEGPEVFGAGRESDPLSVSSTESQSLARPRPVKNFCADPGCQEQPESGSDRCFVHLTNQVDCMTEGCRNKTADKEVPLCDKCRKEQCDAAEAVATRKEPHPPRPERPEVSRFVGPQVYSTFRQPRYPVPTTVSLGNYDEPKWHLGNKRGSPQMPRTCAESHCSHFPADGKDGLCNECFMSKTILNDRRDRPQGLKCRTQGCQRPGESKFGLFCESCQRMNGPRINTPPLSPSRPQDKYLTGSMYDQLFSQPSRASDPHRAPPTEQYDVIPHHQGNYETPYSSGKRIYSNLSVAGGAPAIPPRDPQVATSAYINQGFEPGVYSLMPTAEPKKCVVDQCERQAEDKDGGLCDICYQQSVKQEEMIRNEQEKRRQAQSTSRAQKLPADSPYLNPVPCKTVGCPRTGIRAYEDLCAVCHDKDMERNLGFPLNQHSMRRSSVQPTASQSLYDTPPVAHQEPVQRQASQNCSTPGCAFFASPEYGTLCSKCFMEKTKADARRMNPQGDTLRHMEPLSDTYARGSLPFTEFNDPALSQRGSLPCRNPSCNMYGRQENDGFCSMCCH